MARRIAQMIEPLIRRWCWKTLTVFHIKPAAPPASSEEPGQAIKHERVEGCGFGQGPGFDFNRGKASYTRFITS